VEDVRRFLAFRVTDLDGTITGDRPGAEVYRLSIDGRPSQASECVFFAVSWPVATLVLQFR
jgi:hypothetical protein